VDWREDEPSPDDMSSRLFVIGDIMRVTFLIRARQVQGTALQNAARYDAGHLATLCHTSQVLAIPEADTLMLRPSELDSDVIVIEGAGWVSTKTVAALSKLGPRVIVRTHAAPEFLYYEFPGPVSTSAYLEQARAAGAELAFVSADLAGRFKGTYLPIYYPVGPAPTEKAAIGDTVDVGCFGAIRPLKNHMGELVAIARARDTRGGTFRMHINSTRVEGCSTILPELKDAARAFGIELVRHEWTPDFWKGISVGLFGSFAESFCLTAADFVRAEIPSVLGDHIPWADNGCTTDVRSTSIALVSVINDPTHNVYWNWRGLTAHSVRAGKCWHQALKG
jgi:hypothetical protein